MAYVKYLRDGEIPADDQVDDLLGDFLEEDLEFVEEEDEEEERTRRGICAGATGTQ